MDASFSTKTFRRLNGFEHIILLCLDHSSLLIFLVLTIFDVHSS
jgi:hypothetical protein